LIQSADDEETEHISYTAIVFPVCHRLAVIPLWLEWQASYLYEMFSGAQNSEGTRWSTEENTLLSIKESVLQTSEEKTQNQGWQQAFQIKD
jgi:hypothetical protein